MTLILTLVQAMSGCHHVTIHYLSQWWLGSVSLSQGRSELMASQWLHSTHPWINGWRYQDKHVYMNTYIYIYICVICVHEWLFCVEITQWLTYFQLMGIMIIDTDTFIYNHMIIRIWMVPRQYLDHDSVPLLNEWLKLYISPPRMKINFPHKCMRLKCWTTYRLLYIFFAHPQLTQRATNNW